MVILYKLIHETLFTQVLLQLYYKCRGLFEQSQNSWKIPNRCHNGLYNDVLGVDASIARKLSSKFCYKNNWKLVSTFVVLWNAIIDFKSNEKLQIYLK